MNCSNLDGLYHPSLDDPVNHSLITKGQWDQPRARHLLIIGDVVSNHYNVSQGCSNLLPVSKLLINCRRWYIEGLWLSMYNYRISCTAYALTQACPIMTKAEHIT